MKIDISALTLRDKVYHSPRLTLAPPPLSGGWGGTTQTDSWGVCGPSYKVDAAKECFMVNKFPSAKPDRVKTYPISDQKRSKTISLWPAHTSVSHIRQYPALSHVGLPHWLERGVKRIVGLLQSEPQVRDLLHVMGVNRVLLKPVKWRN